MAVKVSKIPPKETRIEASQPGKNTTSRTIFATRQSADTSRRIKQLRIFWPTLARGLTPPPSPPARQPANGSGLAASSAQAQPLERRLASSTAAIVGLLLRTRLAGKDLSRAVRARRRRACRLAMPIRGRGRAGNITADHRFRLPRHGEATVAPSSSYPRPPSRIRYGFLQDGVGGSAHRPHNVAPRRTVGRSRTARTVRRVVSGAGRGRTTSPSARARADSAGPGADCRLRSRQPDS